MDGRLLGAAKGEKKPQPWRTPRCAQTPRSMRVRTWQPDKLARRGMSEKSGGKNVRRGTSRYILPYPSPRFRVGRCAPLSAIGPSQRNACGTILKLGQPGWRNHPGASALLEQELREISSHLRLKRHYRPKHTNQSTLASAVPESRVPTSYSGSTRGPRPCHLADHGYRRYLKSMGPFVTV